METATILLVDDEAAFVETMAKRLTKRGFRVRTALSGEEALMRLEEEPGIEVVILDVKMPGMNGNQALKRIKASVPLVEVIMLTGHATIESAIDGMKMGAFDYLLKPCNIDELVAKLTEAGKVRRDREDRIIAARMRAITHRKA